MKALPAIFVCLILVTYACVPGDESPVPPDIIRQEEMKELLLDVHLLEAYLQHKQQSNSDTVPVLREQLYSKLLKKHQATPEEFHKSIDFYLENAHLLHDIYPGVVEMLSETEGRIRLEGEEYGE